MMKRISDTDTLDQLEQLLIQSGAEYRRAPASLDTASAPVEIASQIESLPSGEVFVVRQGPACIANRTAEPRTTPCSGENANAFAPDSLRAERVQEHPRTKEQQGTTKGTAKRETKIKKAPAHSQPETKTPPQ